MPNLSGQILADRYRIDEFIGRGGMAEVYKVWDRARATFLALKLLRDDLAHDVVFVRRFQREARSLETLQHPNIVRFYGLEQDDMLTYILMDHVEGSNLRAEIYRYRQTGMPPDDVVKYMQGICSALHYAHHSGIIHCDLKSGNVLIDEKGRPLVTDFGIARMTDTATTTLVGVGTPAYMAPEQILGRDPTPQTDIYSLGITLYEMLTGGERPFTGERATIKGTNSEKVRWEQIYLPPPSPCEWNNELTPEVEAVVMKCLSKEPNGRYDSALALLNDLKRAMLGIGVEAMPGQIEHIATNKQMRKRKRLWNCSVIFGSILLVLVGLLWSIYFGNSGRQAILSLIYSPTPTATATATSTPTATATLTYTATPTLTLTASATATATASLTPTSTPTQTFTLTPTSTQTLTPTSTPTPTLTDTLEPTQTLTPTLESPAILDEYLANPFVVKEIGIGYTSSWMWEYEHGKFSGGKIILEALPNWDPYFITNETFPTNHAILVRFSRKSGANFNMGIQTGEFDTTNFRGWSIHGGDITTMSNREGANWLGYQPLIGNLTLKVDDWYYVLLAVKDDGEFLALLWDANDPTRVIHYDQIFGSNWMGKDWRFRIGSKGGEVWVDSVLLLSFDGNQQN
jgi:serine/threonine protein kinase